MAEFDPFDVSRWPAWGYVREHPYIALTGLGWVFVLWSVQRAVEHRYAEWLNERIDSVALRIGTAVRHTLLGDHPFTLTIASVLGFIVAAHFSLPPAATLALVIGIPLLVMIATSGGENPWHHPLEFNPEPPGGFESLHHLDPRRIFHEIDQQQPLQREAMAQSYVGQAVDWQLVWVSGEREIGDPTRLRLTFSIGDCSYVITGQVGADAYPQFNRLPAYTVVRVRGTIKSVQESLSIRLGDITVVFEQEAGG